MKYFLFCINIGAFLALYIMACVGLAVFRTHSISVAHQINKIAVQKNGDNFLIEQIVGSTGNAIFYYQTIAYMAGWGCMINIIVAVSGLGWNAYKRHQDNKSSMPNGADLAGSGDLEGSDLVSRK